MSRPYQIKRHADLLASVCLLAISIVSVCWAYPQVSRTEQLSRHLLFSIADGEGSLVLLNEQGCVAKLRSVLVSEQLTHLRIQGALKLEVAGQSLDSKLEYRAQFNPLGQLKLSSLSVSSKGLMFRLQSKGVDPIQLTILGQGKSSNTTKNLNLPGPISIAKVDHMEGEIRHALYYQGLPKGLGLQASELVPNLLRSAQLPILRLAHDSSVCDSKPEARLNLDGLLGLSKALGEETLPFPQRGT